MKDMTNSNKTFFKTFFLKKTGMYIFDKRKETVKKVLFIIKKETGRTFSSEDNEASTSLQLFHELKGL